MNKTNTIERLLGWLRGEFEGAGINAGLAGLLVNVVGALLLVFLSWLAYLVAKRVVLRAIRFLSSKTGTDWDKVYSKQIGMPEAYLAQMALDIIHQ